MANIKNIGASIGSTLLMNCRMALGLTQQQFADIFGCTKRTVIRWEERGTVLLAPALEALARALYPVRPDLAAQVAAAGETTLEQLGIPSAAGSGHMAIFEPIEPIESIVRAAADAMGVTPEAVRPALAAAFARAREVGLDVQTVAEKLT
jgi:transcriptional regulator with XRE-family HTH domain